MHEADERRKNDRVSFRHELRIRRLDGAQHAPAEARDLSICGMSFDTDAALAVGDEVRIHIANVVEHAAITARVRSVIVDGERFRVGVEHVRDADAAS